MASLLTKCADRLLRNPELRGMSGRDFDSPAAAAAERRIFARKRILQVLYEEYCRPCRESAARAPQAARMLEIGAGTSPLQASLPDLLTSDVVFLPWLNLVCSARQLPFADASLDRMFLLFVFHHLDRVENFLVEVARCLKPGGELVIVDPAITAWSRLYYRIHVDRMEVDARDWGVTGSGRLSASNIALAWIVFIRDSGRFQQLCPELELVKIEYNTCLAFLLSGGMRIRQLLPTGLLAVLFQFENWLIRRITKELAVTMAITIRRRAPKVVTGL